ncbi:MAG: L-aspartate--L-methionine ligase LdmS, partial [Staphylococcus equorum]
GFDLLVDSNDDIFAIDLNFRQNGSTSMLLLEPFLQEGYHKFYSYLSHVDNSKFFNTIMKYVNMGVLFPLSYYDGDWFDNEVVKSRFGCIWHGENEAYVEKMEQQFLNDLEEK